MKSIFLFLAGIVAAGGALGAQNSSLTIRNVRDPVQLRASLNANALDAETRIAIVETTIGTNENATVTGTLAVTGVATFTAESVHNGGVDADYITVDAAAGIDTKTAGTLLVGAATATKVEVAKTAVETEIQGTLDVQEAATFATTVGITGVTTATGGVLSDEVDTETATALLLGKATATSVTLGASDAGVSVPGTLAVTGVVTLTAAPVLVSTNTAADVTLTMTNAPTAATTGAAAPIYVNITVGGVGYVIPAWPISE